MDAELILKEFRSTLLKQGKSAATAEAYCRDARHYLLYLQQHRIALDHSDLNLLQHYQKHLEIKHGKINSVRRSVIGIRQFFRYLSHQGHLTHSPPEALIIPPRDEQLKEPLSNEEVRTLLRTARQQEPKLKGMRDAVIISLLGTEGLKVSELIKVQWSDYISLQGMGSLRIRGGRTRVIQLHRETHELIRDYRTLFKSCLAADNGDKSYPYMILAYTGRDTRHPAPSIGRHGLKFLLSELAPVIQRKTLNTEMLRHYAICSQLRSGKSPEDIMQHLGLKRPGNITKHLRAAMRKHLASPEKDINRCLT